MAQQNSTIHRETCCSSTQARRLGERTCIEQPRNRRVRMNMMDAARIYKFRPERALVANEVPK